MTEYADYTFYTNEFLPNKESAVSAADFTYYARKATQEIKRFTGSNADRGNIPECVKMCCCELVELLCGNDKLNEQADSGVTSESVQGWSRSYSHESAESRRQALNASIRKCVYKWLSGTGLMYRGVKLCL